MIYAKEGTTVPVQVGIDLTSSVPGRTSPITGCERWELAS